MPSTIASARGRCFQGTGFVNKGGARERVQTAKEGGGWQKAEKAEGRRGRASGENDDDGGELRSTEQRESQRWWWLETKRGYLLLLDPWHVDPPSLRSRVLCLPSMRLYI